MEKNRFHLNNLNDAIFQLKSSCLFEIKFYVCLGEHSINFFCRSLLSHCSVHTLMQHVLTKKAHITYLIYNLVTNLVSVKGEVQKLVLYEKFLFLHPIAWTVWQKKWHHNPFGISFNKSFNVQRYVIIITITKRSI